MCRVGKTFHINMSTEFSSRMRVLSHYPFAHCKWPPDSHSGYAICIFAIYKKRLIKSSELQTTAIRLLRPDPSKRPVNRCDRIWSWNRAVNFGHILKYLSLQKRGGKYLIKHRITSRNFTPSTPRPRRFQKYSLPFGPILNGSKRAIVCGRECTLKSRLAPLN